MAVRAAGPLPWPSQGDGRGHGHHHVAGVRDRRVGQQPLHVRLPVGGEVAEGAGDGGQQADQPGDVQPRRGQGRRADGIDGRGEEHRQPGQQPQRGGLRGDGQEGADLGRGPLEDVRRPEMERHGGKLERQPRHEHQSAEDQRQPAVRTRAVFEELAEMAGHRGQLDRAEGAGQEADAVEHDGGGGGPEDGVFQRRFAALAAMAKDARRDVRRHAGHLHAEEHDQGVVGRDHQAHAQHGPEHNR